MTNINDHKQLYQMKVSLPLLSTNNTDFCEKDAIYNEPNIKRSVSSERLTMASLKLLHLAHASQEVNE